MNQMIIKLKPPSVPERQNRGSLIAQIPTSETFP